MKIRYIIVMLRQLENRLDKRLGDEEKRNLILSLLVLRQVNIVLEQENHYQEDDLYIPSELRWEFLKNMPDTELKRGLYRALQLVQDNSEIYGNLVFPESVQGNVEEPELRLLLDGFSMITGNGEAQGTCGMAEVFEYICSYLPPERSETTGAFYTPLQVSELMIQFLQPTGGRVYDPCCGSGALLLKSAEYISKHDGSFQLYGHEADSAAWRITCMKAALRGITVHSGEDIGDTFKADFVLGNPPFGTHSWEQQLDPYDPKWKYGMPPLKRGEFAWLQLMLYHLRESGKMAIVLSNGVLDSSNNAERRIRAGIIKDDILEAIVTLPAGLFYCTKISVSYWIINKSKNLDCRNKILLIDARNLGVTVDKTTILPETEMQRICQAYEFYQQGRSEDQQGFSRIVKADEIETEDYSLAPEQYIVSAPSKLPDIENLEAQEERLEAKLKQLMDENRENFLHILKRL
ncbi:N-6 DNA methylase [Clostridium transplantifaecale]|uniref:N-6 DNA methylase n=1 Tax=Clostridium transplantifaecale TaxID=2479838 RepID=UPI0013DDDA4A|nr:N-6 DNA methylase [Clostridium transplantifaecale]